ncbi:PPK2 family polyphosphate kinase [Herbiconiux ginsengi]|uniref:Polyphosphate:nucleotide phosphotransferase, PPK2 family n=1 Tax=Herbiconiux ginsengi TaxID=381665 RepID=A0A1H3KY14_9MICO|nr:PPK2 family polyphosphate kinase [Herbiconiux ginsengi]SDY56889.1 polyphosphate:nucleotide phosphotransferase, PPK2 family [Herbiconiux ginsengi]
MTKHPTHPAGWSDRLRVSSPVDLSAIDTSATPGVLDKDAAEEIFDGTSRSLPKLQEKLFADSLFGGEHSVLVVLQGMDTAGKGGTVKRVAGPMDPQGITHHAFKKPTEEELAHPFLWRVEKELPAPGQICFFDRSHYEDVLVPRVHELISSEELTARYAEINEFERRLVEGGTTVLKVMLHLGRDEQKNRLLRRLDRSDKHWKFNPGDVDDRGLWPLFHDAYEVALTQTDTEHAPWHVVPADKKWYSSLAVQQILNEALQGLDLGWPAADYDVDEQRKRLLAT